jgi:CHAT domain-containing protein
MSRKYEAEDLSVAKWLEERRIAPDLKLLLVVNPTEDLQGADVEGKRIEKILKEDSRITITKLERRDATWSAVRAAFRSGKFDVVHYAGHAFFDPNNRARSGIICYGKQVLSGIDLANLETLPALMFFNACEAGRIRTVRDRKKGEATAKRLETNVGLAEALLRAGVGNYIGTHWPVRDAAATRFAETFYRAIMDSESIGVALQQGRAALRNMPSVDWADYIHYGSPRFVVKCKG